MDDLEVKISAFRRSHRVKFDALNALLSPAQPANL
jgi:hypothetical protein